MKSRILLYMIALAGCLCACQQEDELSPSHTPNPFAPLPGASDEESELRARFYEATGCYLLFNDTIRREYKGLDENGKPFYETELVGLEYTLTSVGLSRFEFDYLQTLEQKRRAAQFLQNDLFPYIKSIMPYSILIVNGMDEYTEYNDYYEYAGSPLTYSNMRCLALNVNRLWELSETELKAFAQDVCCEMIFASFGGDPLYNYADDEGKAKEFFKVNQYNYGNLKEGSHWLWGPFSYNPLEMGFLADPYEDVFMSAKEDALAYIKACLMMTEEEFFEKYGEADIEGYTRQKYDAIKPLIDETGIKYN